MEDGVFGALVSTWYVKNVSYVLARTTTMLSRNEVEETKTHAAVGWEIKRKLPVSKLHLNNTWLFSWESQGREMNETADSSVRSGEKKIDKGDDGQ